MNILIHPSILTTKLISINERQGWISAIEIILSTNGYLLLVSILCLVRGSASFFNDDTLYDNDM